MKVRTDEFCVGDRVEFMPPDEYGYSPANIPYHHELKYGPGPYMIEEVTGFGSSLRGHGHTQGVTINGEVYSGAWFKPLRAEGRDDK